MMMRLNDLPIHQAIQAPLEHPLTDRYVRRFGGVYAPLWDAFSDSHPISRPIQPIAKRSSDAARHRGSL
jgi:hypothetical protein